MGALEIAAAPAGVALAAVWVALAHRFAGKHEVPYLASGLIVAALIYVVAALVRGSGLAIAIEVAGATAYTIVAVLGLRRAAVLVAVGWFAHIAWDLAGQLAEDPVLPLWYALACLGFDATVAAWILRLVARRRQLDRER